MRCACIFFRFRVLPCGRLCYRGHRRRLGAAATGQPGRYGSGFLVQPVAVRRARALWLVARARRSAAKAVHCLRVASSAAANRDHRATTKPRTTRRRRPGRLHPSLYRLSRRARESNRTGCQNTLVSTRSAASPPDAPQHAWEQKKLPASWSEPPDALAAAAAREIINARRKLLDHTRSCPALSNDGRARIKYRREGPAPV